MSRSLEAAGELLLRAGRDAEKTIGNSITVLARVVSAPIPLSTKDVNVLYGRPPTRPEQRAVEARSQLGISGNDSKSIFMFRGRIEDGDWEQNPHRFIPDPCEMSRAGTASLAKIQKTIELCTKFTSEDNYAGKTPKVGDWVNVRINKIRQPGSNAGSWDTANGDFVSMAIDSRATREAAGECRTLVNLFQGDATPLAAPGGAGSSDSLWEDLIATLPSTNGSQIIDGPGNDDLFAGITNIVNAEKAFWDALPGNKERQPGARPYLLKYWNIFPASSGISAEWSVQHEASAHGASGITHTGEQGEVHWSAAFISWLMRQHDPAFPISSGHLYYAQAAAAGSGGWTAWKLHGPHKIRAQLGDIICEDKTGPNSYGPHAGHCDAVYRITGGKAYAIGGNVGDSVGSVAPAGHALTSEGYYDESSIPAKYSIVLKKNGVASIPVASN